MHSGYDLSKRLLKQTDAGKEALDVQPENGMNVALEEEAEEILSTITTIRADTSQPVQTVSADFNSLLEKPVFSGVSINRFDDPGETGKVFELKKAPDNAAIAEMKKVIPEPGKEEVAGYQLAVSNEATDAQRKELFEQFHQSVGVDTPVYVYQTGSAAAALELVEIYGKDKIKFEAGSLASLSVEDKKALQSHPEHGQLFSGEAGKSLFEKPAALEKAQKPAAKRPRMGN